MKTLFSRLTKRGDGLDNSAAGRDLNRGTFYLAYTLVFALLAFLSIAVYHIIYGKSFVWVPDGLYQHYIALVEYGKLLRTTLRSFFIEHSPYIPTWNNELGFGADSFITLHYYAIGDPLNLLSVFFKPEQTEVLFSVLIFIRIWLAGLAFSFYCFFDKTSRRSHVLFGAIAYAFCGYTLFSATRHPFFINALICFPLVCSGIDRLYVTKRPFVFMTSVALAAFSNFYFFLIECVFFVLYAVFKFFAVYDKFRIGRMFLDIFRFTAFFLVGLGVAAVLFVPEIVTVFSTSRASTRHAFSVLYEYAYYIKMLAGFSNSSFNNFWNILGFNAVSLFCLCAAFLKRKYLTRHKIGVVLLFFFMLFPLLGSVLNGLSYISNRWCFAFAFLVCIITVKMLPEIFRLSAKQFLICGALTLAYLLVCAFTTQSNSKNSPVIIALVFAVIIVCFASSVGRLDPRRAGFTLFAILCVSIVLNGYYRNDASFGNYVSEFENAGIVYDKLTSKSPSSLITRELSDEEGQSDWYRYEVGCGVNEAENSNLLNGLRANRSYWSLTNGYVSRFMEEMCVNASYDDRFTDLNARSFLEAFVGTRYFIASNADGNVPYVFRSSDASRSGSSTAPDDMNYVYADRNYYPGDNLWALYSTDNYVKFGATYSSVMSQASYDELSPEEKERVLLQCAVVNDGETGLEEAVPDTDSHTVVEYLPYTFVASSSKKSFSIEFDNVSSLSELYLVIEGFGYRDLKPSTIAKYDVSARNADIQPGQDELRMTDYQKSLYSLRDFTQTKRDSATITVGATNSAQVSSMLYLAESNNFYSGKQDYIFNLGYFENIGKVVCNIKFSNTGEYTFGKIRVVAQPQPALSYFVNALNEEALENIKWEGDSCFRGEITVSSDKIMQIPIAYSEGWHAFVDGREADILRINTMFMGVELQQGSHTVEFRYSMPHAKLYLGISSAGLALLLILSVVFLIRSKKKNEL